MLSITSVCFSLLQEKLNGKKSWKQNQFHSGRPHEVGNTMNSQAIETLRTDNAQVLFPLPLEPTSAIDLFALPRSSLLTWPRFSPWLCVHRFFLWPHCFCPPSFCSLAMPPCFFLSVCYSTSALNTYPKFSLYFTFKFPKWESNLSFITRSGKTILLVIS